MFSAYKITPNFTGSNNNASGKVLCCFWLMMIQKKSCVATNYLCGSCIEVLAMFSPPSTLCWEQWAQFYITVHNIKYLPAEPVLSVPFFKRLLLQKVWIFFSRHFIAEYCSRRLTSTSETSLNFFTPQLTMVSWLCPAHFLSHQQIFYLNQPSLQLSPAAVAPPLKIKSF